jgi:VWFA-related protein
VRRTILNVSSILLAGFLSTAAVRAQDPVAAPQGQSAVVDVVAVDRDGRFVEDLQAADFTVTVDGVRRAVQWVRRVSRGPGAMSDAATRRAAAGEAAMLGAEGERTVFVLIDEASITRGDERAAVQAAGLFLDRLGLDDRVGVLRLPLSADARLSLTTERAETRLALSQVAGQRAVIVDAPALPTPPAAVDPADAMSGLDPEKPRIPAVADAASPVGSDSLRALRAIFDTLRPLPGRKVVVLFSAGVPTDVVRLADDAALAAAGARATVYAFGLRSGAADAGGLSTAPLDRLATATGGAFASLARNPERVIERAVRELGACYVLGVEPVAPTPRPARRALKVETAKKGITIRSAAWLVPLEDTADRSVPTAYPVPTPASAVSSVALTTGGRPPELKHDPELDAALARLFAYADAYERQYAMLVAEEDYKQSASKGSIHLRSDFLLVRPSPAGDWICFRDVFEVDGRPVRDREERLRRLFLEGTPEALRMMETIRDESARYNIGIADRTVNVPLLPFVFLRSENRGRFEYRLDGREEAGGVEVVKIRYSEWARPTLVSDGRMGDQPVSGWLLVDPITGAVVETRMEAKQEESRGRIVVRYRRDPALGLWVPSDMNEEYSLPDSGGSIRWGGIARVTIEGHATYSNYRRFQVKTEEKITPPK